MPICELCQQDLPIDNFIRNASRTTGCHSNCKECEQVYKIYQAHVQLQTPEENIKLFTYLYTNFTLKSRQMAQFFGCKIDHIYEIMKILDIQRCYKCDQIKSLSDFNNASNKLGKMGICRVCSNEIQKTDAIKECKKRYVENNKEKLQEYYRNHYQDYKSRIPVKTQEQIDNKRKVSREYRKKRRDADPIFKLNCYIGSAIYNSLRNSRISKNNHHWEELVGYKLEDLVQHLESQFYKDPNICWDNYGSYWHMDHIIPKRSFKIKSLGDEEFKKCWALINLQPLFGPDNILKSDNIGPEWDNQF